MFPLNKLRKMNTEQNLFKFNTNIFLNIFYFIIWYKNIKNKIYFINYLDYLSKSNSSNLIIQNHLLFTYMYLLLY